MPNWCSTSYRIQGDPKELKQFNKLIQALERRKKPLCKSDFGNLWLGCKIEKLHGNSEETYCRREVDAGCDEVGLGFDIASRC